MHCYLIQIFTFCSNCWAQKDLNLHIDMILSHTSGDNLPILIKPTILPCKLDVGRCLPNTNSARKVRRDEGENNAIELNWEGCDLRWKVFRREDHMVLFCSICGKNE